jgi:ectoine hydroxylase-related dioxygenase (phytanoyl-CoA dioxygenase family)
MFRNIFETSIKHIKISSKNIKRFNSSNIYFNNKDSLNIPWTESPFFLKLIKNSNHTENEIQMANKFNKDGYVIIDSEITDQDCNNITDDVYNLINQKNSKIQTDHYQYNESKRLFEGWKNSKNIKNLVLNEKIMNTLTFLYNKAPIPFSTINFIKGTSQPFHSDAIHFNTIPYKWMTGVWTALEDTNKYNGTLAIIPGSHNWDIFNYDNLKLEDCDTIQNGEEINYRKYEDFIRQLIISKNAKETIVELKKGQSLVWSANLLHGGIPIIDQTSTRKTQVTHYFYKGCNHYYHPMFSKPFEGKYAKKWCDDKYNILNYKHD